MYVGDTGEFGLRIVLWEVVANGVDEFLAGRATRVAIDLDANGGFVVTDDGGGIRPGVAIEEALTTLHSTPSFDGHTPHRHVHSFSGLGLGAVSALARLLTIDSVHPERTTRIAASRGAIVPSPGPRPRIVRGTRVAFTPDADLFEPRTQPIGGVRAALEGIWAIQRGLVFGLDGKELSHPRGLIELVEERVVAPIAPPFSARLQFERAMVDVAAAWHGTEAGPWARTYANLQDTPEHGAHLLGFHGAVVAALEREPALQAQPRPDFRKDYRARLVVALAVDFEPIDYAGPTKSKVASPELQGIVARALTEPLSRYFGGHGAAIVRALASPPRSGGL